MRKAVILLAIFLVVSVTASVAFAQEQHGIQDTDTGEDSSNRELIIAREVTTAQTSSQLGEIIQEREQEMNQEIENYEQAKKSVYQNQNRIRAAVHSLLAMEDLVGGIGSQVSAIAREFNNSVQVTIREEEKIQTRNALVKIFMGGDEEAAEKLEQEVNQNQQRIQELKTLRDQCECDEEVKNIFQEQIQEMEQEQNRIQELAQSEKQNKGLFGWLFR